MNANPKTLEEHLDYLFSNLIKHPFRLFPAHLQNTVSGTLSLAVGKIQNLSTVITYNTTMRLFNKRT